MERFCKHVYSGRRPLYCLCGTRFPRYVKTLYVEAEDKGVLLGANIDTISKVAVGAAAVTAGVHAVRRMKGE